MENAAALFEKVRKRKISEKGMEFFFSIDN
jgi:hypothetical protein